MFASNIIKEKLELLKGQELSSTSLHSALFGDNARAMRRFFENIDTYVIYKINTTPDGFWAKINVKGNDSQFRALLEQKEDTFIITEIVK